MKIDKVTVSIFIFVIILAGALLYWKSAGAVVQNNIATEAEAKWIGNHSTVYTQTGCIHCIEQENLFGANWKYVNSIDCISSPANQQACIVANITGTPTWVINGTQYLGVQSIAKLKELTGYQA